uniref:Lysosomal protein transmembrane 5 n=1 Tax=Latimeria chalumnae TaxID=7897 RepID=H3BDK2_LATCH
TVPVTLATLHTCCHHNARTCKCSMQIYLDACSVLVLITESVTVAKGKDSCEGLCDGYYRIADATSVFLLIILLFLVSVMMLYGVLKYRERLLIPFLVLQILDLCLRVLNLFNFYVDLSAYSSYKTNTNQLVRSYPQAYPFSLHIFCDSILKLKSSLHPHLGLFAGQNKRGINHSLFFWGEQFGLWPNTFTKSQFTATTFQLFRVGVVLFQAYMINCVWKCYKYIQAHNESCTIGVCTVYNLSEKTVLPTYDEVLQLPLKEAPPPYMPV